MLSHQKHSEPPPDCERAKRPLWVANNQKQGGPLRLSSLVVAATFRRRAHHRLPRVAADPASYRGSRQSQWNSIQGRVSQTLSSDLSLGREGRSVHDWCGAPTVATTRLHDAWHVHGTFQANPNRVAWVRYLRTLIRRRPRNTRKVHERWPAKPSTPVRFRSPPRLTPR